MNITNITTISDLLIFASEQTYGFFGLGILILLYIVLYLNLIKRFNFQVSLFFSFLLLLPVATFLTLLNLFDNLHLFVYLILLGLSGVYAFIKKDETYY